ncbi:MAG: septal ring lytic transglycosylase RlpA family protein [Candidatus Zhuqueibacterota bacterium]
MRVPFSFNHFVLFLITLVVLFSCAQQSALRTEPDETDAADESGIVYLDEDEPGQATNKPPARTSADDRTNADESGIIYLDETDSQPSAPAQPTKVVGEPQTGKASYYGDKFQGRKTASGELYDREKMTAAHRTLPFGTICRVTNVLNGKSVEVRVNDRGPFSKNRVIDVSYRAMSELDGIHAGLIEVKVEVIK